MVFFGDSPLCVDPLIFNYYLKSSHSSTYIKQQIKDDIEIDYKPKDIIKYDDHKYKGNEKNKRNKDYIQNE